eukprot:1872658-Rhodomonas_salina.1
MTARAFACVAVSRQEQHAPDRRCDGVVWRSLKEAYSISMENPKFFAVSKLAAGAHRSVLELPGRRGLRGEQREGERETQRNTDRTKETKETDLEQYM